MQSEKEVQTDIIKFVQKRGGYIVKIIKGNSSGISDLIACIDNGIFIGIEVKAERFYKDPEKQMSAWQHKHKKMVTDANGLFVCVATLGQLIDYLEDNLIYL